MRLKILLASLLLCCVSPLMAKVQIIAAENTYGSIAKALGGSEVQVTSIMNNPNEDPHAFTVSPEIHTLLSKLGPHDIFIMNGAGYDSWAIPLVSNTHAYIINNAELNQVLPGKNPHLWYDLAKVTKFAKLLTAQLIMAEPTKQAFFTENLHRFLQQAKKIQQSIEALHKQYLHYPVIATEPVADYLTRDLGLDMHAQSFQQHIMNDTPPSAQERIDFVNQINQHKVMILIYNRQVINPVTKKIFLTAVAAHVPVVGVGELLSSDTEDFLGAYEKTVDQIRQALRQDNARA